MKIKIHKIIYSTTAEGFGNRCCIWVQGCSHHCKGCMSKHTWDIEQGISMDTEVIAERIRNQKDIEGITLLGGEPFEQAKALNDILVRVHDLDLSVIAFTGYLHEELSDSKCKGIHDLLEKVDLLIDGPYMEGKRSFHRPWVGSDNQRFLFLTNRYSEDDLKKVNNRLEIRIAKDGTVMINGMTNFEMIGEVK